MARRPGAAAAERARRSYLPAVAGPGGRLVFAAWKNPDNPGQGTSLWQSDGTAAGTRPFVDLPSLSYPAGWAAAGSRLYFQLAEGGLWVSDLTAAGTYPLLVSPGMGLFELEAAGDHLFFTGTKGSSIYIDRGFFSTREQGRQWARGSTDERISIGASVRVSRPSMRGSPARIWPRTIFFEVEQDVADFTFSASTPASARPAVTEA